MKRWLAIAVLGLEFSAEIIGFACPADRAVAAEKTPNAETLAKEWYLATDDGCVPAAAAARKARFPALADPAKLNVAVLNSDILFGLPYLNDDIDRRIVAVVWQEPMAGQVFFFLGKDVCMSTVAHDAEQAHALDALKLLLEKSQK